MPPPWINDLVPPFTSGGTIVDINGYPLTPVAFSQNGSGGAGFAKIINLGSSEDATVIDTSGTVEEYPVHVIGGADVKALGLHFEIITQPGNGVGELVDNDGSTPSSSPRVPGNSVLMFRNYGTSWVEGCKIDANGHQVDCVSFHKGSGQTEASGGANRNFHCVNSMVGNQKSRTSAVDSMHGDIFQNRDSSTNRAMNNLWYENCRLLSIGNGLTIHGSSSGAYKADLWCQRVFFGDGDVASFGHFRRGFFTDGPVDSFFFNDMYVWYKTDATPTANYNLNGTTYTAGNQHTGTFSGLPPVDFAPDSAIGHNYVSPFGGTEATPFDTREKRQAVIGTARPWMRGSLTPNASTDVEWRMQVGLTYSGNPVVQPPPAFEPAWAAKSTTTIVG